MTKQNELITPLGGPFAIRTVHYAEETHPNAEYRHVDSYLITDYPENKNMELIVSIESNMTETSDEALNLRLIAYTDLREDEFIAAHPIVGINDLLDK